jgi:hypothetical protein
MKKINGGYISLFEYLVEMGFPFTRTINKTLYPTEDWILKDYSVPYPRRYNENPKGRWADQFTGSLQPIASMGNDFQYTFKPYKSVRDALTDIMQPVRGIGNILRGSANIISVPFVLLGDTVRCALRARSLSSFLKHMKSNLFRSFSWVIDGVSSLIRGATQIITSPLTLALRIPLRGIISGVKGTPDISENEDVKRLVAIGKTAIDNNDGFTMDCIKHRLDEEYQKLISQGNASNFDTQKKDSVFNGMNFKYGNRWVSPIEKNVKENSLTFLGLFEKQITPEKHSSLPDKSVDAKEVVACNC